MHIDSTYVHTLEGRLRIKAAGVKGSPSGAGRVEARLREIAGVLNVAANPMTGNVLVLYDPAIASQGLVVDALRALGCLPYKPTTADLERSRLLSSLTRVIAQAAAEAAVQRALIALI